MPYRAAECLCVRLGPSALRVASNLSQSARLGSEGIVISSPGPDLRATRRGPENKRSGCAARFLVTGIPSEAEVLGHKIQYREGRHFFCVRPFEKKS
jgi:hypothetical protein